MPKKEADVKADIGAAKDRGEGIGLMEPLLIGESSRHRPALTDLALELAQKSAGFRRSLPESLLASLADLVRAMNCYYSNLIEGHDTHPIDIERALKGDYSNDTRKARPPARGQGAYRGPAVDRRRRHQRQRRHCATPSARSTGASARSCPRTCYGSRTHKPRIGSRSSPANCVPAMSRSAGTSPSARRRCRASLNASRKSTANLARPRRSSRQRQRTTVLCGFTRSSTAMDVWHD